jgi:hypothetical protein
MIVKEELTKLLNEIIDREFMTYLSSNKDSDSKQYLAGTLATTLEIAKKFDLELGMHMEVK